jgi:hypothetical protein
MRNLPAKLRHVLKLNKYPREKNLRNKNNRKRTNSPPHTAATRAHRKAKQIAGKNGGKNQYEKFHRKIQIAKNNYRGYRKKKRLRDGKRGGCDDSRRYV